MRFTSVLLPGDAAQLLEGTLVLLDAVERARTPEELAEALAAGRSWVVGTSAALRQADARGKAPASPQGQPAAPAVPPAKSPCGCREAGAPTTSPGGGLGSRVARVLLARAGWSQAEISRVFWSQAEIPRVFPGRDEGGHKR